MLPQIYRPLCVVILKDGRRFFFDRIEKESYIKKVNESYMVETPWGATARANVSDIEDFDAKSEEDQFLISLPYKTRLRLEEECKKHMDAIGKTMPLYRMRLFVQSFEKKDLQNETEAI
jgi:hypothetical protein